MRLENDTIICTGGHRFWISGSGWVKARDLESQTLLHTVTGNIPASAAKKGTTAETYNLVVADFHTYFVGNTGLLCQDLLIPQPTNNVVPGLPRASAAAQSAAAPLKKKASDKPEASIGTVGEVSQAMP